MALFNKLKMAAAGLALAAAPMLAQAAEEYIFTFTTEFSGSGGVCANNNCATLKLTQVGDDVSFVLTSNLASGEFIVELYGNYDPFGSGPTLLGSIGGTTDETFTFSVRGSNESDAAFKADGDGFFDWTLLGSAAPPRLDGSETVTWAFDNVDIDVIAQAISINGPVGKNGFSFALRVQGLGADNENSGWFYANPPPETPEIPEPGTLALLGAGIVGLALIRRRRRS